MSFVVKHCPQYRFAPYHCTDPFTILRIVGNSILEVISRIDSIREAMAENLKTGFSPGVSSENSPQMTDTTSRSHAPPMVTVKTRRLDAGKQSAAREANGPHQGNSWCPAAPAIQPKPEAYDFSSGEAEAQSVRSPTVGKSISVASSTAELSPGTVSHRLTCPWPVPHLHIAAAANPAG